MKTAILLSGHFRNFEEIIQNFKSNLVDPIHEVSEVDIFIHSWDDNLNKNSEKALEKTWYNDGIITIEDVHSLFNRNGLQVKNIILENQKSLVKNINLEGWLISNTKNRTFHNKKDSEYIINWVRILFYQYYGQSKSLSLIKNLSEYTHIIKTRPDMLYEKFDINLLKLKQFFPFSHQKGGVNINNLFFGGKVETMTKILSYWCEVIFKDKKINLDILNSYHPTDINLNRLFRHYITKTLNIVPDFVEYNPKIYRSSTKITTIK